MIYGRIGVESLRKLGNQEISLPAGRQGFGDWGIGGLGKRIPNIQIPKYPNPDIQIS